MVTLARRGEAENAPWRLFATRRKRPKSANGLEYKIAARHPPTRWHVRAALEEDERNTLFQIKASRARPTF